MREHIIDVEAYFRRIGYAGPREPTLDTLRGIHARHPQAIPFENLDPFLRRPVELDLASLERKLIGQGRGGYCFAQNLLLSAVLRALGFGVTGLAARVVWNAPKGAVRPRGHMLLRVNVEGESYLADVGFGGLTLTAPLRLAARRIAAARSRERRGAARRARGCLRYPGAGRPGGRRALRESLRPRVSRYGSVLV